MPALLAINLLPVSVPDALPYLGEGVRGFVYDCMRAVRADYATGLHDLNQRKPFTLSAPIRPRRAEASLRDTGEGGTSLPPSDEADTPTPAAEAAAPALPRPWTVLCGCLDEELADVLLAGLWQRHQAGGKVRLGPADLRLAAPPWRLRMRASYAELARTPPVRSLSLRFVSPTAVNSHGVPTPLPVPQCVFGSLLLKWNALAPEGLHYDRGLIDSFASTLEVAACRVTTRKVPLATKTRRDGQRLPAEVGFTGEATFRVLGEDRRLVQAVSSLARFAEYAGVGVGTTVGMGQVRAGEEE